VLRTCVLLAVAIAATACGKQEEPVSSEGVAVLPFTALHGSLDASDIADEIQFALLTTLVGRRVTPVISRTSTERYRDTETPVRAIAAELNVKCLVEGVVQRREDRVRVGVQMIYGETGQVMASYTSEHTVDSKEASDLAEEIANNLGIDQCAASAT